MTKLVLSTALKILTLSIKHDRVLLNFPGVSARVMKVAPACAVMISTYEYSKSFFRHYNMEKVASVTVSDTV